MVTSARVGSERSVRHPATGSSAAGPQLPWRSSIESTTSEPRLGLRQNLGQFSLLVGVNALVGGVLGQETHPPSGGEVTSAGA